MANIKIERYIEANYGKWLSQTRRKCSWFGINPGYANDLLQETLFVVFKKRDDESFIEMAETQVHANCSMLEIFISRTRRNLLMNLQRHQGVVARIMSDTDLTNYNAEQSDEITGYDIWEKQKLLASAILRLPVDERTKYILTEKLVCNHNLSNIRERHTTIYREYHQGFQKLRQVMSVQQRDTNL